ncbi:MAG: SPOR domain-containing protein [Candidatus Marinimicrobia bacterium]|nr:SPOR domain-containing protein [Candidatus Neomarinimicrobiota bacterium]
MKLRLLLSFLLGLACTVTQAQDLRLYFALLQEGRVAEVRQSLPELLKQNPNHPGVAYLQAMTVTDGDSALQLYQTIIWKYPQSEYAAEAAMKIGEYLYSRGLYSQASRQLHSIPILYPQSNHLQRAIDLMVNSYFATGELDSAAYYLARFKRKYPRLNYDYGIPGLDDIAVPPPEVELVKLNQEQVQQKLLQSKKPVAKTIVADTPRPWVVQVGAFGKYNNATSLKSMLVQNGYDVEINEVSSNNRRLFAVRVVRYSSRNQARKIGNELKQNYKLNYMVMNRPE